MNIYEITSKTPNEILIHRELSHLVEAAATIAAPTANVENPGILSKLGRSTLWLLHKAGWAMIVMPFYDYYENMRQADANLKADQSPESQNRYNEEQAIRVGLLVSSVAAGLLTKGIFSTMTLFLGFIKYIPFIGNIIHNIITMFSLSAQAYILHKISSEEGRMHIATLLVGPIIGNAVKGIGTGVIDAVKYFSSVIHDALNEEKNEKSPTTEPNATQPTTTEPNATQPTTQSTTTKEPEAPALTNHDDIDWTIKPGDNVYTPKGMGRSASGRLTL